MNDKNDIAAAIEAGKQIGASARPIDMRDGKQILLVPHQYGTVELPAAPERPIRITTSVTFRDAESFADYVKLFKRPETLLFGDYLARKIVGRIDYHGRKDTIDLPSYNGHTAELVCESTEEWERWTGADGATKTQTDFAHFIETNDRQIVTPDGATLFQIVSSLQMRKNVKFKSDVRLSDGNVRLQYEEETETHAQGQIEIPSRFTLGLRPFHGSATYQVDARLRYRLTGGSMTFWFELLETEKVLEDAFKGIRENVEKLLDLRVLNTVLE